MYRIEPATTADTAVIASIGRAAVELAHRESCSAEDLQAFLDETYNEAAIHAELSNPQYHYHLIQWEGKPIGFSKMVFNAVHPNLPEQNLAKLDRIYLQEAYCGQNLGAMLLQFNIELARANQQSGIWLFTWVGNERAVKFYLKSGFTIVGSHRFKITETHYNAHHQMLLRLV